MNAPARLHGAVVIGGYSCNYFLLWHYATQMINKFLFKIYEREAVEWICHLVVRLGSSTKTFLQKVRVSCPGEVNSLNLWINYEYLMFNLLDMYEQE